MEMTSVEDQTIGDHTVDGLVDFVGGIAGGTASVYVGQPLDTVKVKMQTFPTVYRNAFHCFKTTLAQEGVRRGLYAGTVPSLAAQVSENSVLFLAYGMCQKAMMLVSGKRKEGELSVLQKASAGSAASFFSSLTLCPTELIKCKQQAMQEMISTGQITNVLQAEGVSGLFRGLTATFMREMPGYFFFFGGYEVGKVLLTPAGTSSDEIGPLRTMACGALGGVSLWLAVFPADVVKSRLQVQTSAESSFLSTLVAIFKNEGFVALYKGLGPTLLRTAPATAMLFLAYETTRKLFRRRAENQ